MEIPKDHVIVSKASERIEAVAGVLIAAIAALLAIAQLIGNNVEDTRKKAELSHSEMFNWYQSKSVKQSLQENYLETIKLISYNNSSSKTTADSLIKKITDDISRYKKEKKEIMIGSKNLDKKDWVQDLDGKMGVITGVKEWEKITNKLNDSEDKFDISNLFFQIALVLGAVCIIIYDNPKLQNWLLKMMILFAIIGITFAIWGFVIS